MAKKAVEEKNDYCYKDLILEWQQKYDGLLRPVCPAIPKMFKKAKVEQFALPKIPKTNDPLLDSIIKILLVFNNLVELKPDEETVVRWANSKNLLKEHLHLIRDDLLALPQALEMAELRVTSEKCKELIAELNLAELGYVYFGGYFGYLLPDDLEHGNWATFLKWRERQISLAKQFDKDEICHLTRHYPAAAINVIRKLSGVLYPLATKILPEQLLEKKRVNAELKQMISSILKAGKGNKETAKKSGIVKEPSKEAQQAYKLYYSGMKQTGVAKKMTDILKKPVSQGQVSKWIKKYKIWRKAEGIPVDDKKPNIITKSDILDIGARTDGRITGDPRHKKNADYGDNDFNE